MVSISLDSSWRTSILGDLDFSSFQPETSKFDCGGDINNLSSGDFGINPLFTNLASYPDWKQNCSISVFSTLSTVGHGKSWASNKPQYLSAVY